MPLDPDRTIFDLTRWMDPATRAAFAAAVRSRRYDERQVIYLQGEEGKEMYRIVSGAVRLSVMGSDGKDVVFLRFHAGDCFGEASLIDGHGRPHTAEAASDVEVQVLSLASFQKLRAEHRAFDEALMQLLSCQMRFSSNLFLDLSLNDLPGRIARRLLEAVMGAPPEKAAEPSVKLHLSQTEIASMVGATRQTVSRVLRQMREHGIISTEYNYILVSDLDGLRAIAAGSNAAIVTDATE